MRRILIFSLVYYPRFIGGAEVAIKEITDRITPGEVEFDMVTLRKSAPAFERIGNVNVYRVGVPWFGKNTRSSKIFPLSKILYIPLAYLKAVSLHKKKKYDVNWSMMASYAGFAALLFKKRFRNVPFILSIQEGDNFEKKEGIFHNFFAKIFKGADQIQCISKFLADWSVKMGAKCPITIVPNAVDFELFSRASLPSESEAVKKSLGKKDGDIFLVTTSRLVEKNAVGDIISALQYLPSHVKLLIIGKGYEEKMLRKQSRDFADTFGRGLAERGDLARPNVVGEVGETVSDGIDTCDDSSTDPDRVQFLGYVPHAEMPKYLQTSEIFIRPSLSEGFGNSFIEAMAAGIPVIATPVGGIVDFLVDGETGLFCEVKNPRSIAQKVEKLIKDRESREYIVRNAKKMVEEKYGWGKIAGEMKKILISARM